jgi:uncharacterized protein YjiS (DUF1127 family)
MNRKKQPQKYWKIGKIAGFCIQKIRWARNHHRKIQDLPRLNSHLLSDLGLRRLKPERIDPTPIFWSLALWEYDKGRIGDDFSR